MLALVARSGGAYHEKPAEVSRGAASRLAWAWDGLCFGVPFHDADRNGMRDIANNQPVATLAGSAGTWSRDNRGNPALLLSSTGSGYLTYADSPRHDRPTTALTVYARFKQATAGNTDGGIICNVYSAGSPWQTWALLNDSAATRKIQGSIALGSTPNFFGDTAVIPTTEYVSVFLRWRSGEGANLIVLGERGNTLTSMTSATLTGSIGYNAGQGIRINSNEAGSTADARYSQCMVWSRRLGDTEIASLVADPFGWYSPRRETVVLASPFPVVLAGPAAAAGYPAFGASPPMF